jgi:hypothetical protein
MYNMSHLYKNYNNILFNLDGKSNCESKSLVEHKRVWKKYIKKKIFEHEQKKWVLGVQEHKKLRTYQTFKKELKLEKYLIGNQQYSIGRRYHSYLRSGTCPLQIERGRWTGVPKELRLCQQCDQKLVEDEQHVIVTCTKYQAVRTALYDNVLHASNGKWNFRKYNDNEIFLLCMQGTMDEHESIIFNLFHQYLEQTFKIRQPCEISQVF